MHTLRCESHHPIHLYLLSKLDAAQYIRDSERWVVWIHGDRGQWVLVRYFVYAEYEGHIWVFVDA